VLAKAANQKIMRLKRECKTTNVDDAKIVSEIRQLLEQGVKASSKLNEMLNVNYSS
jgi:hypothetical protein